MSERDHPSSARPPCPGRDAIATQRSGKETYLLQVLRHQQVLYRKAIALRMPSGEPEMHRLRLDLLQQWSASADGYPAPSTTSGHNDSSRRVPGCSFRGCNGSRPIATAKSDEKSSYRRPPFPRRGCRQGRASDAANHTPDGTGLRNPFLSAGRASHCTGERGCNPAGRNHNPIDRADRR